MSRSLNQGIENIVLELPLCRSTVIWDGTRVCKHSCLIKTQVEETDGSLCRYIAGRLRDEWR